MSIPARTFGLQEGYSQEPWVLQDPCIVALGMVRCGRHFCKNLKQFSYAPLFYHCELGFK